MFGWIALRKHLFLLSLFATGGALADTVPAPRGWQESIDDGIRVVTNGVATVRIQPWQSLNGKKLDLWLKELELIPPAGTRLISSAGVKPETVDGAYSVIRKIEFANSAGHSVLYACPANDGFARLMTLDVIDANFKDTFVGAMFGEQVCKRESKPDRTQRSVAEHKPAPSTRNSDEELVSIAKGRLPAGLKEVRGVIVMGIQPGGMFGTTEDFIALFSDGTYTDDLVNTFGESAASSRKRKPKAWGQWRMRGGELELKDHNDKGFDGTRGSWVIKASPADYRLAGCFGRLNSSSGADYTSGTTVGLAATWCFWKNGRFSNSSTAFGRSSNASMGVSTAKGRGRYRIDGNVIHFLYDDGHSVTAAFGYASEEGNHLLLNGKRFMGAKP